MRNDSGYEAGRAARLWINTRRVSRYWYLRIMRQKSSPRNLAGAMALGVLIGALPIIPFQSIAVIAIAFMLRVNKLTAWLATCYSNIFTMVPFYYFLFKVGKALLPFENVTFDPNRLEMEQLIEAGWGMFSVMLCGGLIIGIPAAILAYVLTLYFVRAYRRRRALHLLKKRTRL